MDQFRRYALAYLAFVLLKDRLLHCRLIVYKKKMEKS